MTKARALQANALQAMYKPLKPADCPEGLSRGEPGETEGESKKRLTGSSCCHPLSLALPGEQNTPSETWKYWEVEESNTGRINFKNPYRHCKPDFSLLNRPALAQVSVRLPGLAALSTKEKCIHTNANRERGLPEQKIIIE